MKKILLFGLAFAIAIAAVAQHAQLKSGLPAAKADKGKRIAIENTPLKQLPVNPMPVSNDRGDSKGIVTIMNLGTSANAYGFGYAGGQKTQVWAEPSLGAITLIHRMGPGSTPPSLSGYLAIDLGINMGLTQGDWQTNRQVYSATLNSGGTYYEDAARYPQALIYNPEGNTALENAYVAFFGPNLSNGGTWGGYSYGVDNLVNQADSTKHLQWFNPPPYTYIPDGMTRSPQGVVLVLDKGYDETNGYYGNLVLNRGIWNSTTHDYEYTQSTIDLSTVNNSAPADNRIAFGPDGQTAWIVALSNNGGAVSIDSNYYPILFKSTDGGLTWSDPIAVQLDGPSGIAGITQYLLSDYLITQLYSPPYPARDEIPYTTAFDCDICVDAWGNPHIGVVIGLCAGGYSIATNDSSYAVYDIYSCDGGATWSGQLMGYPKTFRGTFGGITEDNRVNISTTWDGDKMFITWVDTQIAGVTDNSQPDVFARGFDVANGKITNANGENQPTNVTFLSDVTQDAKFATASYYVFQDAGVYTVPIVTEHLTATDVDPVDFKYISDFSYADADFTVPLFPENCAHVGIPETGSTSALNMTIYPNPVKEQATFTINSPASGEMSLEVINVVGQTVYSLNHASVNQGVQNLQLDFSTLKAGIYFCTVRLDGRSCTQKMIVQ